MQINITNLLNGYINKMEIKELVDIDKTLLENSLIDELKNVNLTAYIVLDEDNNLNLTGTLEGIMVLKDDLTLEPVEYKFETDLEETIERNKNIIDITDILWQNIIVEIPSKVRSTSEDINLEGNGWRVISEEQFIKERNNNNPFANLDELLNTKEDK